MFENFQPKYGEMNQSKKDNLKKSFFTNDYEDYKKKKKTTQKKREKIAKFGLFTIIIGICTLLFIPKYISPESYVWLIENLGLQPINSDKFGIWQMFTSIWLHGSFLHLALNMFIFWSFANSIKKIWGDKKLLFLYILSGLGGSTLMLLLGLIYPYDLGIGASGAICGLFGAMLLLQPNAKVLMFFIIPMKMKTAILSFTILSAICIIFNWIPSIGHAAHLGGLIVGYLITLYWKKKGILHTTFI